MNKTEFSEQKRAYYAKTGRKAGEAMRELASSGVYPLSLPPGYRRTKDENGQTRIVVVQRQARIVKWVFKAILGPNALVTTVWQGAIAKGLKGRDGKPISRSAFHRMLVNPLYSGKVDYVGKTVEAVHTALISPNLQSRVRLSLAQRRKR